MFTSTENTAVKKTKVLLGTPDGLQTQILLAALRDQRDVEIVGRGSDSMTTLITIARTKPDVWIHGREEGAALQAFLSHVYSCHPSITVIRIDPNDPAGYLQVPVHSMGSLLSFIRLGKPDAKAS